MGTITVKDGTTIYYKDWGAGPAVTFSHGWPLNSDAWDGQMLFHRKPPQMKETAKVLNISLTAAKGRLFQGRGALRKSGALRGIVRSRTETAA